MKKFNLFQLNRFVHAVVFFLLLDCWVGFSTMDVFANLQEKLQPANRGREILKKAVEAAGGQDVFHSITNFSFTTQNVIIQPTTKTELEVTEIAQLPDTTKQIMKLKIGTRIQVLQGNNGWKKIGDNISDLSKIEIREMQRGLFRDTINLFKRSDSEDLSIEYQGDETVDGKTNHILQIKDNLGEFFTLYINAQTHLVEKKTYHGTSGQGLATLEEIYSDHRNIAGVTLPFYTEVRAMGKLFVESKTLEVKFNVNLERDFFQRK